MKKIISIVFLICIIFSFASCSTVQPVTVSSCELYETSSGVNGKFVILNSSNDTLSDLKAVVCGYDKNQKEIVTKDASYSLEIKPEEEATVTVELTKECESAKIISYSFVTSDGKEKSGEFSENNVAVFPPVTTENKKISTRAQLAEILIEDIEHQFMLQAFESHGYYDEEKNQLVIASYITKTYDECYYAYSLDNTVYDSLADSVVNMSKNCYEEFQSYNFNDVQVSIGFLSSDERIMISATNGELVDMFN